MKERILSALKVFLSLGFAFFLIYLFYQKLTPSDILDMKKAIINAHYPWLVLAVSFTVISQALRAIRWQSLLEATGHPAGFSNVFHAISINYLVNSVLPKAGEFARCGVLATHDGIPVQKSVGTVINERIIDLLSLFAVGMFAFIFEYKIFIKFYNEYLASTFQPLFDLLLAKPILSIIILAVAFLLSLFLLTKLLNNKNKAESKLGKFFQGFIDGILSIFKLEKPLQFIGLTVLIWICYFAMIVFAFKTLDQSSHLGYGAVLSLLFFGTFAFIATPGGIGAYPIIAGYLLAMYGLEIHLGNTFGWILWVGQTVSILILGLIAFVVLSRQKKLSTHIFEDGTENS